MSRRPLSNVENYHLWVASGGMCSFEGCNKRLIMDTDGALTNVGIKAHIIGHAPGSARHEFAEEYAEKMGFCKDNLEDVRNLMLMCYDHSVAIDDKKHRDNFPPDLLFAMKHKHEEWVQSWHQEKKKSIALIHKRKGTPMTSMPVTGEPPTVLLDAVEDQTEFSDYTVEGWLKAKEETKKLYDRFVGRIRSREADVAEVYPLSPIPLLIYLGHLLSDTVPYTVYQYNREEQLWVCTAPKSAALEPLNLREVVEKTDSKTLVATVSVSAAIDREDVLTVVGEPHDRLDLQVDNPHVKRVLYAEQVQEIQNCFKEVVERLVTQKKYKRIHLFYAGPAGLAIQLGRSINQTMWPPVAVYHFEYRASPSYQYAFEV